jgi:hypothetical protein
MTSRETAAAAPALPQTFAAALRALADQAELAEQQAAELLREHAWIYRRAGERNWVAHQDRIQQGAMEHRTTTLERPDGAPVQYLPAEGTDGA